MVIQCETGLFVALAHFKASVDRLFRKFDLSLLLAAGLSSSGLCQFDALGVVIIRLAWSWKRRTASLVKDIWL
jgi:hypothetical protein